MAGIDDKGHKVDVTCDWTSETCPRNFLSDDLLPGNSNIGCSAVLAKSDPSCDPVQKVEDLELDVSSDPFRRPDDVFSAPKRATQGAFAERMATRPGFSPLKINTEQIKPAGFPGSSTDARSPYVTIPPGLSPTTLLDSPVFLLNSLVQPSPTTGKLSFGSILGVDSTSTSDSAYITKGSSTEVENETFAFKPPIGSNLSCLQTASSTVDAACDTQHPLISLATSINQDASNHSGKSDAYEPPCLDQKNANHQLEYHESSDRKYHSDTMFNMKVSEPTARNDPSLPDQLEGDIVKDDLSSAGLGQPSDDGYNWRKYGQKQVKGSEYPRSYYKCTHPNCEVKKKVERSPEGVITEIIYKGSHIHSKPPPSRRACTPVQKFDEMQMDASENLDLQPSVDSRQLGETLQNGTTCPDWRHASNDVTASASFATDFADPLQTQSSPGFESADAVDVSSTISNDEEDPATQGSLSIGGGDEDESESKRRKLDAAVMDLSAASRAVREPRVVVQTTSEVDILDDGYRWRKYGQKVVKGNPNPRSYYKCTSAGCNVRKHVERAAHDLKSVITTYEGKHNHEVPAARNSAAANSSVSGNVTSSMSQSHSMPKRPPEFSHMQDSYSNFVMQPGLGVYGIPGREQLGPSAASFTFGLGQQGLSALPMPPLVPGSTVKMLPPMHPYLGSHQPVADGGFVIPKELDSTTDADLQTSQQFINR